MSVLLLPLLNLLHFAGPSPALIELKGYFRCNESLLAGTKDALVCYAPTQRGCRAGTVILAYEKRRNQSGGKPVFYIADTVQVRVAALRRTVTITHCTAGGRSGQYFVVFDAAASSARPHLSPIFRVWGVNSQGRLAPVAVKTVQCINQDFGSE